VARSREEGDVSTISLVWRRYAWKEWDIDNLCSCTVAVGQTILSALPIFNSIIQQKPCTVATGQTILSALPIFNSTKTVTFFSERDEIILHSKVHYKPILQEDP
jgi:hypothetical protein